MDPLALQAKYIQLANNLRIRLHSQMNGQKLPSIRALMNRFGVSQHTVMAALSILEQEQLISRKHGSGIYRSETHRIPIIAFCRVQYMSHELGLEETALLDACVEKGWKMNVYHFEASLIESFAEDIQADGFVLSPEMVTFRSRLLLRLENDNIPRVVLGRTGDERLDFVFDDETTQLEELVRGLVVRGHRRIAFFANEDQRLDIVGQRVKQFKVLAKMYELEYAEVLDPEIRYGQDAFSISEAFLRKYLSALGGRPLPFTALITWSRPGSATALRVFFEANIHIPRDCSLCCMGVGEFAQYTIPSLTNAEPHYNELAEACLQIIEKRLAGDTSPLLSKKIDIHTCWRESVGKAPSSPQKRSRSKRKT
jgi:DNA-binding LacI/PurR family transcriptional regulator